MSHPFPLHNLLESIECTGISISFLPRVDYGAEVLLCAAHPETREAVPLTRLKFGAWSEDTLALMKQLKDAIEQDTARAFARNPEDLRNEILPDGEALEESGDDDPFGMGMGFST